MNDPTETVFLLNTRTPWEEPPRARHQVAEALAKHHPVYFVSANEKGVPGLRQEQVDSNLTVLRPSWPVYQRRRYRLPVVNELYQNWLFLKLRKLLAKRSVFVINFDHTATQLFRYFDQVAYYCNDYHIRNYPSSRIKRYFERCERVVAARSKFCVGTCEYLRDRLSVFNPNAHEIRLGAPAVEHRPVFRRTEAIRVGLVGFLDEKKTSLSTLDSLAALSKVEMTIYGTLTPGISSLLEAKKNLDTRGVLCGEALIRALHEIDVGIAPYTRDDGNPGRTPNKLWLYLLAGKPCVVTDLSGIQDWKFEDRFVYRAKDPEDFSRKVLQAYEEDSEELAVRRHEFAKQNSWDRRIDELLGILRETESLQTAAT